MANRESFPSALFPMRGDVSAEAGATTVTVTGIQQTPVTSDAPVDTNTLVAKDGVWQVRTLDGSIQINGFPISDDYDIFVNLPLGISGSPVLVNGV